MKRKNGVLYLAGFALSQLILIAAVLFVNKSMPLVQIFVIVAMVILVTFLGDFCLFGIIRTVIRYHEEKQEIEHLKQMNQKNYQFYQFAVMQQRNIRFFYHDLSNHLMTLQILKEQGKDAELKRYSDKILQEYHNRIPQYKTGNVMMDILIQYYQLEEEGMKIEVNSEVPEDFDYQELLQVLQCLSEEYARQSVGIELKEKTRIRLPKEPSVSLKPKLQSMTANSAIVFETSEAAI